MPDAESRARGHAVVVSPGPPGAAGGVERSADLVAGLLQRQGWRVSTVWPRGTPPRSVFRVGLSPLWLSRDAARAARAAGPAELIVTNGFLGAGFPRSIPRVHLYHGTLVCDSLSIRGSLPKRELLRRLLGGGLTERACAARATVICVSRSAADEVRRFYRVRADAVMPNPVDTTVFRSLPRASARAALGLPEDVRLALFVGRPDERKGVHLLPGAVRRAGYELAVAGPAELPGARSLGVLRPERLALAYNAADCVVAPSSYEACSFVVLEALACGVPLISTRVGWMRDLLRAHPAYEVLCVERDQAQIADRLMRLPTLAAEPLIGEVQAWVAANHNLDAYARRWEQLLGARELAP